MKKADLFSLLFIFFVSLAVHIQYLPCDFTDEEIWMLDAPARYSIFDFLTSREAARAFLHQHFGIFTAISLRFDLDFTGYERIFFSIHNLGVLFFMGASAYLFLRVSGLNRFHACTGGAVISILPASISITAFLMRAGESIALAMVSLSLFILWTRTSNFSYLFFSGLTYFISTLYVELTVPLFLVMFLFVPKDRYFLLRYTEMWATVIVLYCALRLFLLGPCLGGYEELSFFQILEGIVRKWPLISGGIISGTIEKTGAGVPAIILGNLYIFLTLILFLCKYGIKGIIAFFFLLIFALGPVAPVIPVDYLFSEKTVYPEMAVFQNRYLLSFSAVIFTALFCLIAGFEQKIRKPFLLTAILLTVAGSIIPYSVATVSRPLDFKKRFHLKYDFLRKIKDRPVLLFGRREAGVFLEHMRIWNPPVRAQAVSECVTEEIIDKVKKREAYLVSDNYIKRVEELADVGEELPGIIYAGLYDESVECNLNISWKCAGAPHLTVNFDPPDCLIVAEARYGKGFSSGWSAVRAVFEELLEKKISGKVRFRAIVRKGGKTFHRDSGWYSVEPWKDGEIIWK